MSLAIFRPQREEDELTLGARLPRGWTLLETLIVLGLLAMLAALVLPAALEGLDERKFESSADVVTSQILMARSHAQATGTAMEVVYEADPPRVSVREFEPDQRSAPAAAQGGSAGRGDTAARPQRAPSPDRSIGDLDAGAADSAKVPDAWASRPLAQGLTIEGRLPSAVEPVSSSDEVPRGPTDSVEDLITADAPSVLRLAVMLPDGTSMMSRQAWLTDGAGRVAALTINSWTGEPLVQRVVPAADGGVPGAAATDESAEPSRSGSRSRPSGDVSMPVEE